MLSIMSSLSPEGREFFEKARELRKEFASSSADLDATGAPPLQNLKRIFESGFYELRVPRKFGGLAPDVPSDTELLTAILTEFAAGESSTAHIWQVQMLITRTFFNTPEMPEEAKRILAREILEEGARFCMPTAEAGRTRFEMSTTCKRVPGGVVLTGHKKYGTGSQGARYSMATANYECDGVTEPGVHFLIVRTDADGVSIHNDWNHMGQRATGSNSVTYENVFVPDGWHWHAAGNTKQNLAENRLSGPFNQISFTATILGSGLGALDALSTELHTRTRTTDGWPSPVKDPVIQHDVGRLAAELAGARALTQQAARSVSRYAVENKDRGAVSVEMMQAKICVLNAVMNVTSDMFTNLGASSSGRNLGLDRFWRNARTLSLHDPINVKYRQVGQWVLEGTEPPISSIS
jgi:alkylation response protein AidB-like acyl-CoA dehydrogenase